MWRSVKTLATAFMVLAFSVTIAIWGFFSYHNVKADLKRTYLQQSDIVLNLTHEEYSDVIEQAERFLVRLSRSEALADDGLRPQREDLQQIVQYGHNVFSKSKAVKLALVDGIYFHEPAVAVPREFVPQSQEWYRAALRSDGDLVWSDPYLDYFDQRIVVTVSQAVRSDMAVLKGVAAIDFDLTQMSRLVGQKAIGDLGVVMLMNDAGEVLSNTNRYWLGQNLFGDRLNPLIEETKERHAEVRIWGDIYFVKLRKIDENGMVVATAVSAKMLDEQLWRSLLPVFFTGLLSLSAFGAVAYFLLHRAFLWLHQFAGFMRRAEQGDYAVHAPVSSYGETGTLAAGFNRMIDGIRERDARLNEAHVALQTQEEQLRSQYEALERSQQSLQRSEAEVRRLAYTDTLTGLLNRRSLYETLERIIRERPDGNHAVLFFDLDDFKTINDTLGHEAGDVVLSAVSLRLNALPHRPIHSARIGGDEFVVVAEDYGSADALHALLEHALNVFDPTVSIGRKAYAVTGSLGVAIYPEHGRSPDALLRSADLALYEAKGRGKNRLAVFDDSLRKEVERRARIEQGTREALRGGQFELVFQPIYELRSGRLRSVETLLRCTSPELAGIPILDIIRTAEKSGTIVEIEKWVLRHAWEFAVRMNRAAASVVRVTVNLSAVHVAHPGFVRHLQNIMEETGVHPEWVGLEITETATMEAYESSKRRLEQLKELRIPVLLDDFGTGYSSLTYLKDLPIDVVKIDKTFVDAMSGSERNQNIVNTIVQLAHHLGLTVVAEGVETKEQAEKLVASDCDMVQGYYYSKPVTGSEVLRIASAAETLEQRASL